MPSYRTFSWGEKISYFSKPFQARILRLYLLSWVGVWWIIKFSRNALQNKNKNTTQPLWPKSWDLRKENLLVYEHSLEVGKAFCSWYRSPHSYCRMGSLKSNEWLFKKKNVLISINNPQGSTLRKNKQLSYASHKKKNISFLSLLFLIPHTNSTPPREHTLDPVYPSKKTGEGEGFLWY